MNKLFLTMLCALVTTIASAQFSVTTAISEVTDTLGESTYNITDKIGVLYAVNDKLTIGVTKDGEEDYELLGRYNVYMDNLWVAGVYNMSDSEDEMMDKMELGLGYSFNVWKSLSIDPYYVMPMKENEAGEREGKFNLGLSYKF